MFLVVSIFLILSSYLSAAGIPGTANSGSGGGAVKSGSFAGGNGGSGIVIVKYIYKL